MAVSGLTGSLVREIERRFEDFGGPVLAVSDLKPLAQGTHGVPLPLVLVMATDESVVSGGISRGATIHAPVIRIRYEVGFLMQPVLHRVRSDATAFYAHYDHERIRDRLIRMTMEWRPENGVAFGYSGMSVHAMPHCVMLCFRLQAEWVWCPEPESFDPGIVDGRMRIAHQVCIADDCREDYRECNPCGGGSSVSG